MNENLSSFNGTQVQLLNALRSIPARAGMTVRVIAKEAASIIEDNEAEITALRAALDKAEARKVKPLVWKFDDMDEPMSSAPCIFGYYITNVNRGHVELLIGHGEGAMKRPMRIVEIGATRERLEELAMIDCTDRINSALEAGQ